MSSTFVPSTSTPRLFSCFVQFVADGNGVFTLALPPAGTVVQCRFDFQMHPES